jgi:hypothetical protein
VQITLVFIRCYTSQILKDVRRRYSEYARHGCTVFRARQLDRTDGATNLYLQSRLPNLSVINCMYDLLHRKRIVIEFQSLGFHVQKIRKSSSRVPRVGSISFLFHTVNANHRCLKKAGLSYNILCFSLGALPKVLPGHVRRCTIKILRHLLVRTCGLRL